MQINNNRGGARLNAGAPKKLNKAMPHSISLTDKQWLKFKNMGGAAWLRAVLNFIDKS